MRSMGFRKIAQRTAALVAAFALFLVPLVFLTGDVRVALAFTPGTGNGTFNASSGTIAISVKSFNL